MKIAWANKYLTKNHPKMLFNQKSSKFNKKTIFFSHFSGLSGASSAQPLGFFNFSNNGDTNNNIFDVEFDVFENQEFQDPDDNHVGLDINSFTSNASSTTWYWSGGLDQDFNKLKLNNGINCQVWIDFMGSRINVTMARASVAKTTKLNSSISKTTKSKFKSKLKNEAFIGTKPLNTSSKKFNGRKLFLENPKHNTVSGKKKIMAQINTVSGKKRTKIQKQWLKFQTQWLKFQKQWLTFQK